MPRKSRRFKALQSKRKKIRQRTLTPAAQQPAVAQTHKPTTPSGLSAPSVSAPTPKATLITRRYPYVAAELRRIGILAGIMLGILIVLALVLS